MVTETHVVPRTMLGQRFQFWQEVVVGADVVEGRSSVGIPPLGACGLGERNTGVQVGL